MEDFDLKEKRIEEEVKKIFVEFGIDEALSLPEKISFKYDMGIDSISFIKLIVRIEDTFNIRFDDEFFMRQEEFSFIDFCKTIKKKIRECQEGLVQKGNHA